MPFAIGAALAVLAPFASANVVLDTYREYELQLAPGEAPGEVLVPFHLDAAGLFYAKLLVTPWNPVNDGEPHGSVVADHSAGVEGWWIEFRLLNSTGAPVTADAARAPIEPFLGAYVDSTPTALVPLAPGTPYQLGVRVHVPLDAATAGAKYRVPMALAYRSDAGGGGTSGASLDASRGFTVMLTYSGTATGGGGALPVEDDEPPPEEVPVNAPVTEEARLDEEAPPLQKEAPTDDEPLDSVEGGGEGNEVAPGDGAAWLQLGSPRNLVLVAAGAGGLLLLLTLVLMVSTLVLVSRTLQLLRLEREARERVDEMPLLSPVDN